MTANLGDSFLVGILSAFSTYQTGILTLVVALVSGCLAGAALHFWSWLWNTQWNGPVLMLLKVLVFFTAMVLAVVIIGVSHAQDYISATALKLRSALVNSADWRGFALRDAYDEIQRRGVDQRVLDPSHGGNVLELRNKEELKVFSDSVARSASRAVAEASIIPITLDPDSSGSSLSETGRKFPITVTPNNQLADRALDRAIDYWTTQARSWCNDQLGSFRSFTLMVSLGIFLLCMAISGAKALRDIST